MVLSGDGKECTSRSAQAQRRLSSIFQILRLGKSIPVSVGSLDPGHHLRYAYVPGLMAVRQRDCFFSEGINCNRLINWSFGTEVRVMLKRCDEQADLLIKEIMDCITSASKWPGPNLSPSKRGHKKPLRNCFVKRFMILTHRHLNDVTIGAPGSRPDDIRLSLPEIDKAISRGVLRRKSKPDPLDLVL